jgi:DNA modification methylase
VPEVPQDLAAGAGDQAVTIPCACEHCGHEFEADPEGGHRLLCGDATSASDVARLMGGEEADICFTSPPYAQQRDYKTGAQDWDALMQGAFSILPARHGAQVLVNLGLVHRDQEWLPYWDNWIEWMRSAGRRRFGWYVWDQGHGLPGDWHGRLAPSHEFIFHFNHVTEQPRKSKDKLPASIAFGSGGNLRDKDGGTPKMNSPELCLQPRKISDSVIRVMRQHGPVGNGLNHPAPFPIDLPSEVLTAFSDASDTVYEPFAGSGTTIIAAEITSRLCCAIDIAPAYVDVAVIRWSKFTGRAAVLADDGRTFDEIAVARRVPT